MSTVCLEVLVPRVKLSPAQGVKSSPMVRSWVEVMLSEVMSSPVVSSQTRAMLPRDLGYPF